MATLPSQFMCPDHSTPTHLNGFTSSSSFACLFSPHSRRSRRSRRSPSAGVSDSTRPMVTSNAGRGGSNASGDLLRSLERLNRRDMVLGGLCGLAGLGFPARRTFQAAAKMEEASAKTAAEFPLTLSSTVSTVVKRPKASRSDREKAAEEEVLVIRDIELDPGIFAKFDVFVNAPDTMGLTPSAAELAGSFTTVPHKKEGAKEVKAFRTNLTLALTDLLKEIGAEDDESIVVTLVPRAAAGKVSIGGVGIRYIKIK